MYHPKFTSLAGLRRLLPLRPVTYAEALIVAECQANRLASACGQLTGSIEAHDLLKITPITLEAIKPADRVRHSGSSAYRNGRWIIYLNSAESSPRQRFTLAHELKHIIDASNSKAYSHLSAQQIELICDHFAACLLMSKLSVHRLWGDGVRTPESLARAMRVSVGAVRVRLQTLGLPVHSKKRKLPLPRARRSDALTAHLTNAKVPQPVLTPEPSGATP